MARPNITTPVETTIMVLRSVSDWTAKYADELETIFGEDYDAESLARQLAERLEEHEETYVREQREDVGLTNQREAAVQQTQRLVSSAVALATIAFTDAENLDDLLGDFSAGPPSHIRSPQAARKALTRLTAALEIHDEPMADKLANFDDFKQQVRDTITTLEDVSDANATETAETKSARRKRDAHRTKAVDFIRNMQLAAEALAFMQPDALDDLHAIFDTHVPTRRPTVRDEDTLDDATDDDPQAPTPAPDSPAPADADVDADIEEPTEG